MTTIAAKSDIVIALQVAANIISDVDPRERQRLLVAGIDEAAALQRLAALADPNCNDQPGFMKDIPVLAEMAGDADAVEVLIAAGMSMLAGEIERLRCVVDQGIGSYDGRRVVIGQGRKRELLKRRQPSES